MTIIKMMSAFVLLITGTMMLNAQNSETASQQEGAKMQEYYEAGNAQGMEQCMSAFENAKFTDEQSAQNYYMSALTYSRYLAESGDINGAIDIALDLDKRAQEIKSEEGKYICYEILGAVYYSMGNNDAAIEAYQTVLTKREQSSKLDAASEARILPYLLWVGAQNSQWDILDKYAPRIADKSGSELLYNSLNIIRQCNGGNRGGADKFVKEAEKYAEGGDRMSKRVYDEAMVRYYEVTGNSGKAIALLKKLVSDKLMINSTAAEKLSSMYAATKNYEAADSVLSGVYRDNKAADYSAFVDKLSQLQSSHPLKSMEFAKQTDVNKVSKKKYYIEIGVLLLIIVVIFVSKYLTSRTKTLNNDLRFAVKQTRKDREELESKKKDLSTAITKTKENIRFKSAFLSNMTHEIRTPLNSVLGFSELIRALAKDDEHKEYAGYIRTESSNLLGFVNNILDLSRIDSGRLKPAYGECNVYEIILEAVHRAGKNEDVNVSIDCPDNILMVTDSARLLQIVTNLLTNAYKFAKKGEVRLIVNTSGSDLILRCEDEGPGISPENAELVFERFEKLGSFETGPGLGLSICRGLASIFGGHIKVDTSYQNGAAFVLQIPLDCRRATAVDDEPVNKFA